MKLLHALMLIPFAPFSYAEHDLKEDISMRESSTSLITRSHRTRRNLRARAISASYARSEDLPEHGFDEYESNLRIDNEVSEEAELSSRFHTKPGRKTVLKIAMRNNWGRH